MFNNGFQCEKLTSLLFFNLIDFTVGALTQLVHDLKHTYVQGLELHSGLAVRYAHIHGTV